MDSTVLLIGGTLDEPSRLKFAFSSAAPSVSLRMVQTARESQAYPSGIDAYADRAGYPIPRLILLDLDVAQRSGLEVLQWVKTKPGLRQIPVIVLTSGESSDVEQAYALGASSCLLKSMNQEAAQDLAKGMEAYAALLTPEYPARARVDTQSAS